MSKIEKGRKLAFLSESRGNKSELGVRLGVISLAFNDVAVNDMCRSGLPGAVACWKIMVSACPRFNLLIEWRHGRNV